MGLTDHDRLPFLGGDSAMIAKVRAYDWRANPLGEPSGWSPELVATASFVLESGFPALLVWGPEMITIYNDAFRPILGDKPESLGQPLDRVWAEIWTAIEPLVSRAYAGQATFIEDHPLTINRYGYDEATHFTFCYSPVRLGDGSVAGMIGTVMETTKAVQARERTRLLNNELGHRIKNTMAMVQAIAQQSLRHVTERDLVDAFKERIVALGHANDILVQLSWEGAPIGTVIAAMLETHGDGGRIETDGDEVALGPKAVLSLSLLLHELATNAAKYGCLSVPGGRVVLSWRRRDDDFILGWREVGGPPAETPARTGFGSRIIKLGLLGTHDVDARYLSTGFEAEFRAPFSRLIET